jgi:hypothetical protein
MEDREATQGHTPEEIIAKLPQVDVLVSKGKAWLTPYARSRRHAC